MRHSQSSGLSSARASVAASWVLGSQAPGQKKGYRRPSRSSLSILGQHQAFPLSFQPLNQGISDFLWSSFQVVIKQPIDVCLRHFLRPLPPLKYASHPATHWAPSQLQVSSGKLLGSSWASPSCTAVHLHQSPTGPAAQPTLRPEVTTIGDHLELR